MEDFGHEEHCPPVEGVARFSALMKEVRQGSQDAAEQVWRQYGPHVLHVVRRSLQQRMRTQFDSQDFSQAVWASFFAELPDEAQLDTPAALVRFLSRLARNKVVEEHRKLHARGRNLDREEPLDPAAGGSELIDKRSPSPSQEAVADDLVAQLTAGQPPLYGRIVQMRREGLRTAEIAEREQTTTRRVRRVMRHLTSVFKRQRSDRYE